MKSSFKIFKIFGISVNLHISFILFILFLVTLNFLYSPIYGIKTLIFMILLFSTTVLHELAHSIMALKFKFKVNSITLYPIGGAAEVEIKKEPKKEFFIAFAGPFFNFVFAWICLILLFLITKDISFYLDYFRIFSLEFLLNLEGILGMLIWINFILGVFNLFFPAFPMDGGRVLRAIFAMHFDYVKATKIALLISLILLFIFGLFAIFLLREGYWFAGMMFLIIIMFLFIAGSSETKFVEMREKFKGIKAKDITMQLPEIDGNLKVKDINSYLSNYPRSNYTSYGIFWLKIFPVFLNGNIYGYINIDKISKKDGEKFVYEVVDTDIKSIDADVDIAEELENLIDKNFIVVRDKNFNDLVIGYITRDLLLKE